MLARIAIEDNNNAEAERHLRHYLELRPGDPRGLAELGSVLLASGRGAEGVALLEQALEAAPELGVAHLNLGAYYAQQGEFQAARRHLEPAAALLPDDSKVQFQWGNLLFQLGETREAEAALRRALALNPALAQAHYALAGLWRRQGRAEEADRALRAYQRLSEEALAASQRKRQLAALHGALHRLLEQDRLEEAVAKAEEILGVDSKDDLAHYRLAQIAYLRHEEDAALAAVRDALRLKDFEPAYRLLEAMCLARLGRLGESETAYRKVVELSDYAEAHAALGELALARGDVVAGVKSWRRAVELEPENPEFRLGLADALEQAGEWAESERQRAEARALQQSIRPH